MFIKLVSWILIHFFSYVHGFNFPFEGIQLADADVSNYSAIAFGAPLSSSRRPWTNTTTTAAGECKLFPGDPQWPSDSQWGKFNATLGGVLIRGMPPASVCYQPYYNATQCAVVRANYFNSNFRSNDPVEIVNEWLDGDSCPPPAISNATWSNATCNVEAYPAYVVNATTVKRKSAPRHLLFAAFIVILVT
jgi:hypothetical protein